MGHVPSGEIRVPLVHPPNVGQSLSPNEQELTAAPGATGSVGARSRSGQVLENVACPALPVHASEPDSEILVKGDA
jgi:hypothetical protein